MTDKTNRIKVGDSNFESWYSEEFQATEFKTIKQIAREAYEGGLNDALVTRKPKSVNQNERGPVEDIDHD